MATKGALSLITVILSRVVIHGYRENQIGWLSIDANQFEIFAVTQKKSTNNNTVYEATNYSVQVNFDAI
jgi:hypothetical protein